MVPLMAMNVWQSIDGTTEWIATMMLFGGGLLLIVALVIAARLKRLIYGMRETNRLLEQIAESRGTEAPPTFKTGEKPPPVPPGVYKLD